MCIFLTLAVYVAVFALQEFLRPKPKVENARPASLGDFNFPTADENRKVPVIWGTEIIEGPNVIWYDDLVQQAIVEKVKTGLWSSTRVTRGFRYFVGIQFGLCRGSTETPVSLRRVWIGETEVFSGAVTTGVFTIDLPSLFGGDTLGSGGVVANCLFYPGSDAQTADPYLSQFQAVGGVTSRYRRTSYVVFQKYQDAALTIPGPGYIGNTTSVKPWKFELRRIPNGLGLSAGEAALNLGNDANLANVAYEIMTDTEWGLGVPAASIDVADFQAAAATTAAEGNGFSCKLEEETEARDLLREVERQMGGVVYLDLVSGLFKIKLARFDYTVGTLPVVSRATCLKEIRNPVRSTWVDTSNQVFVPFRSRRLDYKPTRALAQDMANVRIQGGRISPVSVNYPGVHDEALANSLAWRDLRTLARPMLKAQLVVNRTMYQAHPFSVLALTDAHLGCDLQPMRVQRIDYGHLDRGDIILDVIEDVFLSRSGSYGAPPGTGWTPPSDNLAPFAKVAIFEAPRAFLTRDPAGPQLAAKIWGSGEKQGNEAGFKIQYDTPSLPGYVVGGEALAMMFVGVLNGALARSSSPVATVTVTLGSALEKSRVLAAFLPNATAGDLGVNLANLIRVGDELLLVLSAASTTGNDITLSTVYRGVLDTAQADHANGADVQFLFAGGGLTDDTFDVGTLVDVKLQPFSRFGTVALGSISAVSLTMADRARRPYPPARISVNGTSYPTTGSLEFAGTCDTFGLTVLLTRRDYRTTDEVVALTTDAAALFADFPAANTTEHEVEVRNDPAGANTLLITLPWQASATFTVLRNKVLRALDGVLPTTLGLVVAARHVDASATLEARVDLLWAFSVTTALTGQFNFGALDQNETSNLYTATTTGQYDFTLCTALATGGLEFRLNGGTWTAMSGGGTSWNIPAVTATDTVEIRHTSATAGTETFLAMAAAGAGQDGYAVLFKP